MVDEMSADSSSYMSDASCCSYDEDDADDEY